MNANFFDASDPISIIRFLANFKLTCYKNNIYKGVATWVLLFEVKNTLAPTLKRHMSEAAHINPVFTSANTSKLLMQKKLLQSYPGVVNFSLKISGNEEAID